MCELPRTDLGSERVACGTGEDLYPLHGKPQDGEIIDLRLADVWALYSRSRDAHTLDVVTATGFIVTRRMTN